VSLAAGILGRWAPVVGALELTAASHGRFEVRADGELVFDAREAGRMPAEGEVEELLVTSFGPALDWR